jgi:hypothetical protein
VLEQAHHAQRGARHEARLVADEPAERSVGQTVDILLDRDAGKHRAGLDPMG